MGMQAHNFRTFPPTQGSFKKYLGNADVGKETRLFDLKLLVIDASRVFENTAANFLGKLMPWLQVQGDPECMSFLKGKDLETVPVKQFAQLLQTKL